MRRIDRASLRQHTAIQLGIQSVSEPPREHVGFSELVRSVVCAEIQTHLRAAEVTYEAMTGAEIAELVKLAIMRSKPKQKPPTASEEEQEVYEELIESWEERLGHA